MDSDQTTAGDEDDGSEGEPRQVDRPARTWPALEREASVSEWNMQSVLELIMADPVAMRRGIRLVRLHHDSWLRLGEPTYLHCPRSMGDAGHPFMVPVENTGRRAGWVRWLYRRAKDGKPRATAPRPISRPTRGVD